MYALAVWADGPVVSKLEESDMKMQKCIILRNKWQSDAVAFALMGIRSVHAEWHLSVVTLALQLAVLPDDHIRRRTLVSMWDEWQACVAAGDDDATRALQ
jgi:hypothetical protein